MSAYVIGVVRSATRLDALTHVVRDPADPAAPWRVEHASELRPLAPSSRPELWSAWCALASVREWNEATLGAVLAILRETVPCADPPGDLPALGPDAHAPPEPRATAAHPRAYRGTKHRPPRAPRPDAVDVRPYLLTRRHTVQVLALLGRPRGIDPYVAWNHGADASAGFDPAFVMHLLPLLRQCSWSDVAMFAALARTLELQLRPELRAALVGVYLAAGDPARALAWWSHVLAHAEAQRLEVAQLVSVSGVAKLAAIAPELGATIASLPALQQWSCYRGLVAGASAAYLLSGLQLGAFSDANAADVAPGRADLTAVIDASVNRLAEAMAEDSGSTFWRHHLWRICGHQPELAELLRLPEFVALQPAAAFWLLRIAASTRWTPETAEAEWRALAPRLPRLAEFASRLPPAYQRKFVEDMGHVYGWASDDGHDIVDALAACVDLALRVARSPLGTKAVLGSVLPALALLNGREGQGPGRREIRDAPDASWLALEHACRRENRTRLLARGLGRLARFAPALLVSTFPTTPGALLPTAELLAAVSFETAQQIVERYSTSPLADPALADAPIERLCERVAPVARSGGPNPVRRALRQHLLGRTRLTDAQLRGHRERIVADLGIIRLAAIRQDIERALAARVGIAKIETAGVRHALAMLGDAGVHRRPLRRMLTARLAGDAAWTARHPRAVAWFARHPKLDRDVWLRGIETRGEVAGIGDVRLAIEADPLEALKLGTHVGSCLGRGGRLESAAAAVVLDVNKRVVYARDARGAVVARQLLAVSEADELVCFAVYAAARAELLQPRFREFDRAFAARLGISVFGGSSSDYEIASILSHDWWDDGAMTV